MRFLIGGFGQRCATARINWLPCKVRLDVVVNISQPHGKNHLGKSDGVVAVCQLGVAGDDVAGLTHLVVGVAEDAGESLLQLSAIFQLFKSVFRGFVELQGMEDYAPNKTMYA